jgi:hypothetical protein
MQIFWSHRFKDLAGEIAGLGADFNDNATLWQIMEDLLAARKNAAFRKQLIRDANGPRNIGLASNLLLF